VRILRRGQFAEVDRLADCASPLQRAPLLCVSAEDLSHRSRGEREKLVPAVRADALLLTQLEVGLVRERRRAQRVVAAPAPALPVRDDAQLFVQDGDERIEGCGIPALETFQEPLNCGRDPVRRGARSVGWDIRFSVWAHSGDANVCLLSTHS